VIGFAALRENDYITHLFIDTNFQNKGLGKLLLDKLLSLTESSEVRLRASVNAQNFYESQGFVATEVEQNVDGVRFVPMRLVRT
ncbi:GNAT family N-acetyltransferase, partial [Vibrio diabolicus]|nr:GNAT family N-acetyltransferase [Vibrio diabolicus]